MMMMMMMKKNKKLYEQNRFNNKIENEKIKIKRPVADLIGLNTQ